MRRRCSAKASPQQGGDATESPTALLQARAFPESQTWQIAASHIGKSKQVTRFNERLSDRRITQVAGPPALAGALSGFMPSALRYPSFTRHFCWRTFSSTSAKARTIISCSGRAFSRSSACPVPRGSFANSTIFPQSAGGMILTTADDFSIFLYGQKAQPMLFFSSAFTNCPIHSSVFAPDSPIQIGTSYCSRKSMYGRSTLSSGAVQYLWNV